MSRLVLQVKQSSPAGLFREIRNGCSLIFFGKLGRRVDNASDNHRETRYWCAAIGKEGHSDLEYTTLDPWVRPAEGIEANERSGLPGARAETGPIRKKCRERAARHDRFSAIQCHGVILAYYFVGTKRLSSSNQFTTT